MGLFIALSPYILPSAVKLTFQGINWLAEQAADTVSVNYERAPGSQEDLSEENITAKYKKYSGVQPLVSYLKPYENELRALLTNLADSTSDPIKKRKIASNSQRILDILGRCAERIKDENHNFVILVMALMFVESKMNPKVESPFGAKGIMQVKLDTAVDQLLKMDLGTLFALGLKPTDNLFKLIIDMKQKNRACNYQRTAKAATKAIKEYKAARKVVENLINANQLLFDEQFNTSLGIYYLSTLIEDFKIDKGKANITEGIIEMAVFAYNGGKERVKSAPIKFTEYQAAQKIADINARKAAIERVCNKYDRGSVCKEGWKKLDPLEDNNSKLNPNNWSFIDKKEDRQAIANVVRPFFGLAAVFNSKEDNLTGYKGYQHYWNFLPAETVEYFPKVIEAFKQAKRNPAEFSRQISIK